VDDRTTGRSGRAGRGVAAVDEADLILVVADAELDVRGRCRGGRESVVGLGAEEFGVPVAGGGEVVGIEVQGGESTKHHSLPRQVLSVTVQSG
jgi:hypothetical protein